MQRRDYRKQHRYGQNDEDGSGIVGHERKQRDDGRPQCEEEATAPRGQQKQRPARGYESRRVAPLVVGGAEHPGVRRSEHVAIGHLLEQKGSNLVASFAHEDLLWNGARNL